METECGTLARVRKQIDDIISNMTPEEMAENDRRVDEWEKQQDFNHCMESYLNCGASKRKLEEANFKNYKITGTTKEEQLPQILLLNFAKEFTKRIQEGKYCNLIIHGKPGVGKTFTSLCIIREISFTRKDLSQYPAEWNLHGYMSASYVTSDYLCDQMKRAQSYSSKQNKYQLIDSYADVDLLVIDEIGRTNNKAEKDTLFAILDRRYQDSKGSILISNYDEEQMKRTLGDALLNRIQEDCLMIGDNALSNAPNMRKARVN